MPLQQTQLSLEKARVRDLLRYYTPSAKQTTQKHGSLLEIECNNDTPLPSVAIAAEVQSTVENDGELGRIEEVSKDAKAEAEEEIPDDSELLAHDPTLMAFTQLGAFRLNCQRSFISLMDGKHQYIIAEATRSVSLNDPDKYESNDPGEKVYLGARILDMQWGVCPNTIQVFTALDDSLDISTDIVTANKECYVMNDLSAIPVYATRPYVAGWPYMRFYAEVPIHSPTGYVIGTYCVVDDKPRDGLDQKGLDALNEIASAIMNHLALVQMQHGLQRAGEMVRGLSRFVEGKSGSEGLWNGDPKTMNRPFGNRTGTAQTMSTLSNTQRNIQEPTPASTNANSSADNKSESRSVTSSSQRRTPSDAGLQPRERKLSLDEAPGEYESIASTGTKVLFSRACGLIREAIHLDGVMFVDACFRDIAADTVQQDSRKEFLRFKGLPDSPANEKSEWLDETPRITNDLAPSLNESSIITKSSASDPLRRSSLSDILGFSLHDKATLGGITSSSRQIILSQSMLRGLLRQYRSGHIFVFDEEGSLAQNAEDLRRREKKNWIQAADGEQTDESLEQKNEKAWASKLIKICIGARAITFFPLWDPQRDQSFAGGLAWTNDPTRILQPEDITYLAAFGSCVMAEKSRLDALTADRAKADFISSVSHELRSPLHGILASAEALQETSTGFAQDDMVRTITVCGEVLLDTMDQILEYAKMSNFTSPEQPSKDGKDVTRRLHAHVTKATNLDLSDLVETVVEGIFAGHGYHKSAILPISDEKNQDDSKPTGFTSTSGDIMVILSIDWQASWIFESQIGCWKRILMNLFGNALKYTDAGFVIVSLRAEKIQASPQSPVQTKVTLQIDDSGIGMSQEYLKYELYKPFAQEDQKSVGTGLGLSIVRQLVTDLGGTIGIQSEKGYGTTAKVEVSLDDPPEAPGPQILESIQLISDMKTRCNGLTICLIGFEYYPEIGEAPTGILNSHARRMLSLKSSTANYAVDWFGMNVTAASTLHSANGDILIGLQSKLDFSGESWNSRPLIVFEDVERTRHRNEKGIFSLPQPVGPHKLARILEQCLEYISSVRNLKVVEEVHVAPVVSLPTLPTLSNLPNSDLVALVEDINQRAMHALKLLSNGSNNITVTPSETKPIAQNLSDPIPRIDQVTERLSQTSISIAGTSRRSKVLLVEDNPINMKILMNYMKNAKYEYITASNGLEALQEYQKAPQSFKVVFMDISMPVMDGLTSTRQIRLHEKEKSLPRTRIVALTCFSSAEYQRDAKISGIDTFLIKPVPMKTLKPILELDPDNVVPPP